MTAHYGIYAVSSGKLVGFMDPQPGQLRFNRANNNVLVRCEQVRSGNWEFNAGEMWDTDRDPGFVNAAAGDYQLRPDAEVFQHLPNFQRIPVEKVGWYQDPLPARWSVPAQSK